MSIEKERSTEKGRHPDRRPIKTKKAIKTALIKLMGEKDVSQITIKELAEEADINRKTFYIHYNGIHDILDEIENGLISGLLAILGQKDILEICQDPYPLFKNLTDLIYDDFDFYQRLVNSNAYHSLLEKVKSVIIIQILKNAQTKPGLNNEILPYCFEFIASGIISAYLSWFNSNKTVSLEELAKTASILAFHGVDAILLQK
ncbi:TetR/AcrR family transcriptional regulator [Marasmitruncus massiliensis]|uniref:TetR/AcrR family transcriptional regulator n=1 Tax=Marasmitruncus massiliensis TaxID=1944642 RepID=UPI000C7AAE10|nr:TetR/AcrR family transcriptional regulator [Marasmitruncus massiliensis]